MLRLIFTLVIFLQTHCLVSAQFRPYPNIKASKYEARNSTDAPLILTPLIEQGNIQEARSASEVHIDEFQNVTSYSGYFTVNEQFNTNLFFWFFPSENNYETAPVILWLQGGPGASSLGGLFLENGPFEMNSPDTIEFRKYSWTKNHSVIYIDNPAGTGFSFTDVDGYCQNETQVGIELYNALQQFFLLFPELQQNDFFVTGESYAGKYGPAISYTIHKQNPEADLKINLKGLAIGNGLCDPENQLFHGEYLYQLGLIDSQAKEIFDLFGQQFLDFIKAGDFLAANQQMNSIMFGPNSLFGIYTGFQNVYNYLYYIDPTEANEDYFSDFLNREDIASALHVGNRIFGEDAWRVSENLAGDVMRSITPWISELLDHYPVLFYNGQLDILVAYPLTLKFLEKLDFSSSNEYQNAARNQWFVGTELAGYVKVAGNLTEVLVRNSGHLVPHDQPEWALDLISRFVRNQLS